MRPCVTGKLVRHSKASSSTHQLASAFGFNPYGSWSGSGSTGLVGAQSQSGGHGRESESWWQKTLSLRNTSIALDDILEVSPGVGREAVCGWLPAFARMVSVARFTGWACFQFQVWGCGLRLACWLANQLAGRPSGCTKAQSVGNPSAAHHSAACSE